MERMKRDGFVGRDGKIKEGKRDGLVQARQK